uniref:Glutathione S-transferase omega-1 n=1 Tax=Phallusia mammillata TaxID=59560 RepID=A0A6F9DDH0_9ASCI|nr:glutathione S-transferase omega-1 [Phallusia mammillata]
MDSVFLRISERSRKRFRTEFKVSSPGTQGAAVDQSFPLCLGWRKRAKLRHKTVDLATNDASANALPTLARNGTSAIANYKDAIEFLNSVNGRTIVPEKSEDRTKQFKLLEHFVLHIVPFFERAVILTSPREGFDLLLESMSFLENHLTTSSGRFFGGEQPNFVDYGIYPYLDKIGKWTPVLKPHQCIKVQAWLRSMRELPLIADVFTNEKSKEHMQYYADNLKMGVAA